MITPESPSTSLDDIKAEFNQFLQETLVRQAQNLSNVDSPSPLPNSKYEGGTTITGASPPFSTPTDTAIATAANANNSTSDWADPSIASALVASDDGLANPDSVNPVWTGSIGAAVGGVLVQQAAGDTPYFEPSAAGDDQVFSKLGADDIARWYNGCVIPPVPNPSYGDSVLTTYSGSAGDCTDVNWQAGCIIQSIGTVGQVLVQGTGCAYTWTDLPAAYPCPDEADGGVPCCVDGVTDGQIPKCGGGFYTLPECAAPCDCGEAYLKGDGAGGIECGAEAAYSPTADTLVLRGPDKSIEAEATTGEAVDGRATSGIGVYGEATTGVGVVAVSDGTKIASFQLKTGSTEKSYIDDDGELISVANPAYANGTYVVGLGVTQNGEITIVNGRITNIQIAI